MDPVALVLMTLLVWMTFAVLYVGDLRIRVVARRTGPPCLPFHVLKPSADADTLRARLRAAQYRAYKDRCRDKPPVPFAIFVEVADSIQSERRWRVGNRCAANS